MHAELCCHCKDTEAAIKYLLCEAQKFNDALPIVYLVTECPTHPITTPPFNQLYIPPLSDHLRCNQADAHTMELANYRKNNVQGVHGQQYYCTCSEEHTCTHNSMDTYMR